MSAWTISPKKQMRKKIVAGNKDLVRKIAIRVLGGLIQETPKDTNYAAANWLVMLERATKMQVYSKDTALAKLTGLAQLSKLGDFPTVYIVNNVRYIRVLNYGRPIGTPWSLKAPLKYVEDVVSKSVK